MARRGEDEGGWLRVRVKVCARVHICMWECKSESANVCVCARVCVRERDEGLRCGHQQGENELSEEKREAETTTKREKRRTTSLLEEERAGERTSPNSSCIAVVKCTLQTAILLVAHAE